ncbi:MAG: hypothetical protein U1E14_13560 [Geminicoccaceae bacterium]
MRWMTMLLLGLLLAPPAMAAETVTPKGSAFGLVPPAGFSPAERFTGFQDPARGASMLFVELPAAAWDQLVPGLSDEELAGKGITVTGREPFEVAGAEGQLMVGTQREGAAVVDKWMLVFRNPAFTGMVSVSVPQGAEPPLSGEEIRTALASIVVGGASAADRIAGLPFTVTETPDFRLAGVLGGSAAMFTPDGTMTPGVRPFVIVAASLGTAPVHTEHEAMAMTAVRTIVGFGTLSVDQPEKVLLSGAPAVRVRAHGTDPRSGTPVDIVQWLVVGEKGYIRIVGIGDAASFAGDEAQMVSLAESVHLR